MAATVGDVNPKTMENAKRQFVELYGSALVLNTYLKIALVLVSLVALGLIGLNVHTAARYVRRQAAGHPDRRRRPGRGRGLRRHALPAAAAGAALLPDAVRREALQPDSRHRAARVPRLAVLPGARPGRRHHRPERPEPRARDVRHEPVGRRDRRRRAERQPERADDAPFKAAVTFQKVYYTPGTRHERSRETYVAQVDFVLRDRVPNEFVRVNPLGLQVGLLPRGPGVRGGGAMIANAAFLAAVTVVPAGRHGWPANCASWRRTRPLCFASTRALLGGVTLVLFLNLCAIYYSVARWLFLRDTGRKLLHLDRQLATDDAAIEDLRSYLKS